MESGSPVFVLAWVTSAQHSHHVLGEGASVVFVEHPVRGWEIPGGHLEENETPEQALHRELREETGLSGEILSWNKDYYPKGWVAHVVVEKSEVHSWQVEDKKVQLVQWWDEIPPVKKWTVEEFSDLSLLFRDSN